MSTPKQQAMLDCIRDGESLVYDDFVRRSKLSIRTVRYAVRKLVTNGALEEVPNFENLQIRRFKLA